MHFQNMLDFSFEENKLWSSRLYISGLLLMAAALPFSNFMMSISQFVLAAGWLAGGNIKKKLTSFLHNKIALIVCSVFLLHLIGLVYTSDIAYGLKDLRNKLPLFVLPFLMATGKPLSRNAFDLLMAVFVLFVLAASLVSTAILLGIIDHPVNDIRDISVFISHIRFSLLICLAIFICGWILHSRFKTDSWLKKTMLIGLIVWLILFLVILESITGLLILTGTSIILLLYFAFRQKKLSVKIAYVLLITGIPAALCYYVKGMVTKTT